MDLSTALNAAASALISAVVALLVTRWRLGQEDNVKRSIGAREALGTHARNLRRELARYRRQGTRLSRTSLDMVADMQDAGSIPPRRGGEPRFHHEDVDTARPLVDAASQLGWWRRARATSILRKTFGSTVLEMAELYDGQEHDFLGVLMDGWEQPSGYLYDTAYRVERDAPELSELDKLLGKLSRIGLPPMRRPLPPA